MKDEGKQAKPTDIVCNIVKKCLTHSVRDAHLCTHSPPPPFEEMRIYAHGNSSGCTLRCALECIFLLVNLKKNGWTIG